MSLFRRLFLSSVALASLSATVLSAQPVVEVDLHPDPVEAGEAVSAEITVSNPGPAALTGIVLEALVPDESNGISDNAITGPPEPCSGGFCSSLELVTWPELSLEVGESVAFSLPLPIQGQASGTAALETLIDSLQVAAPSVVIVAERPFDLSLHADVDPVAPGGELTYTLEFGNRDVVTANGMVLTLELPPELVCDAADPACAAAGDSLTWALDSLAPGEGGARRAEVSVVGAASGDLLSGAATLSADLGESRATAVTRVGASPLVLSLTLVPDPVEPGETLEATLKLTNTGVDPLFDVVLQTRIPQESNGIVDAAVTGSPNACSGGFCSDLELVDWPARGLEAGESFVVSLPVPVPAQVPSGSVIEMTAHAGHAGGFGPVSRAAVLVEEGSPLDLALVTDVDPVAPGGELTYTLEFGNRDVVTANGMVLTLELPPELVCDAADPACAAAGDSLTWDLGALAPGAGGIREATVSVIGAAPGELLASTAMLSSSAGESRATAATRVADAPLTLSVAVVPDPVEPGERLQATLTLTNTGQDPLFDVVLETRIPWESDGISDNEITGSPEACSGGFCSNLELVTWPARGLDAGESFVTVVPVPILNSVPSGSVVEMRAHASHSGGIGPNAAAAARVLQVLPLVGEVKLKASLNFKKDDKDGVQLKIKNLELPAGFDAAGSAISLNVGGAVLDAELDGKGKFKSADKKDSASLKQSKKDGLWKLSMKRKKGAFADALADEGLLDQDNGKPGKGVSINLRLGAAGALFGSTEQLTYKSKAGKKGKAR